MNFLDGAYIAAVSVAGSIGRALGRCLPGALRSRLDAAAPSVAGRPWVWLHAVSVGELLLAGGILGKLREGGHRVHITTSTEAGLALLHDRLPLWGGGEGMLSGGAFPLDDPRGLEFFFESPPSLFIALETEIWPNLFRELEQRKVPICIINGRLTERSLGSSFKPWLRLAASRLSLVAARDSGSAARFSSLGAPNVELGGNLKADLPAPPPLHLGWGALLEGWQDGHVVIAGNTVEGEEELILVAWERAKEASPKLRLIIAPRQPRRFDSVANWLEKRGHTFRRATGGFSIGAAEWGKTQILLLDTMGELASAYSIGHVALVGGGWLWHGGHNPLEPLHWGVPTLIGPGYSNFEDIVQPLLEANCIQVVGSNEIIDAIKRHLTGLGPGSGATKQAPRVPDCLGGCLQRTWGHLSPYLPDTKQTKIEG